jgi:hypothetical protein
VCIVNKPYHLVVLNCQDSISKSKTYTSSASEEPHPNSRTASIKTKLNMLVSNVKTIEQLRAVPTIRDTVNL